MTDPTPTPVPPARPASRWLRRAFIALGVYVLIGFVGQFMGFNLLGALFRSGPYAGRITDAAGTPIPGAFVAYAWSGQSLHGTTGCQAATLTRTGPSGFYWVGWQGWRLVLAYGWGIGAQRFVWAPGYATVERDGAQVLVPVDSPEAKAGPRVGEGVDQGGCLGPLYRAALVELRTVRFRDTYERVCVRHESFSGPAYVALSGQIQAIPLARRGELIASSAESLAEQRDYQTRLEKLTWPKHPRADDAVVNPVEGAAFCTAVNQHYDALQGHSDAH